IGWTFGGQFSELGSVNATLCLGTFFRAIGIPVAAALAAQRCGRLLASVGIVRLFIMVFSALPLVAWGGAAGVGSALAIACLSSMLMQWHLFMRKETGNGV
ncbi:MAG: hypothetical protein AAF961_19030, partial [Planctomycetota bacterium]